MYQDQMLDKVFAGGHETELPKSGVSLLNDNLTLSGLLGVGISIFLTVIAITAFASLVYSGFLYITAGGDEAIVTKARKNILWALIAVVLALTSFLIIRAVADIPGFSEEINQETNIIQQQEKSVASSRSSVE